MTRALGVSIEPQVTAAVQGFEQLAAELTRELTVQNARTVLECEIERHRTLLDQELSQRQTALKTAQEIVQDLEDRFLALQPQLPKTDTPPSAPSSSQAARAAEDAVLDFLNVAEQEVFRADHELGTNPKKLISLLRRSLEKMPPAFTLEPIGELDQETEFDPTVHRTYDLLRTGERVWVQARDHNARFPGWLWIHPKRKIFQRNRTKAQEKYCTHEFIEIHCFFQIGVQRLTTW